VVSTSSKIPTLVSSVGVENRCRKPCGSFYLIEGPDKPGGPEVVTPYSLQAVYNWLQDLPWQIERTVVASQVA
jgi:hypothetical protein